MKLIQLTQVQPWRYDIHSLKEGDVEQRLLGTFEEVNGTFYFCHPNVIYPGHLSSKVLNELAEELQKLNEPLLCMTDLLPDGIEISQ